MISDEGMKWSGGRQTVGNQGDDCWLVDSDSDGRWGWEVGRASVIRGPVGPFHSILQ